jgi:RecA/RadA recombinase
MSQKNSHTPTGSKGLDDILHGGFKRGELTLIYGEANTGKTAITLQAVYEATRRGYKVLYIDTERSFTSQGFNQAGPRAEEIGKMISLFMPDTFNAQRRIIESLENYVTPKTALIVVDSMTGLYRLSLTDAKGTFALNKDLSGQLAQLKSLVSRRGVACVITGQVHTKIDPPIGVIEPVAKRVLFHLVNTIIRTKSTPTPNVKEFVVERLNNIEKTPIGCTVMLKGKGIEDVK